MMSQLLNLPCVDHWNVFICILKYIKGSLEKDLLYGHNNHIRIICYSDTDRAGSPSDRRSTFGYCVSIGDNLTYWKSKKQNVVARSSVEAKCKAMASATCSLFGLNSYLNNCNLEKPIK